MTFFLAFEAAALEARPVGAKLSVLCFDEDAVAFFAGAFFAVVPVLLRIEEGKVNVNVQSNTNRKRYNRIERTLGWLHG